MSRLRQSVSALSWSVLGELGARVLGPLAFIVLARILVPADFGVVAAATVLVSFAQVLVDGGLGKALVQRAGDDLQAAASTAFRLNAALGLVLTLLVALLAPAVAAFFGDTRITPVLQALAPMMLLSALAAVPTALLQREFRFRVLFWVRLAAAALPAAASIPLALAGFGHWALVAGTLAGQVAQLLLLWWLGGWRPRGAFDGRLARELLGFGRWALLAGVLGWGYGWLDAVVVGRWLGAHEMGLYRTGSTLVTLSFGVLFTPLLPVLYSLFSRAQHELPLLRETLLTVVRAAALVALPVALLLVASRGLLAGGVLGARWVEAGPVIGLLALTQGASWLVSFNGELYRAVGRPLAEVAVMGPLLAVYAVVYVLSVAQGLEAFLGARLALALLGVAVHVLVMARVLAVPLAGWARPLAALGAALATAALLPALPAVAQAGLVALFTVLLWWSERTLVARLIERWRRAAPVPPASAPAPLEV